jgi:hypothetical protein
VKLREVQKLTEATLNAQATERAKERFNSTVISQLMTGIEQGLKNGTVVSASTQNAAPNPQTPKTPEQIRQEKLAVATQTARSGMTIKPPVKPAVWRSGRNPNAPAMTRENKQFEQLNNLFEAIVNVNELATAPQSISNFIQAQLPVITKSNVFSNTPYKEAIQKLADEVESTYASDKGQNALNKLAEFSWSSLTEKNPKMNYGQSKPVTAPQQPVAQPGGPTINADGSITIASARGQESSKILPSNPLYKQLAATINSQVTNK